MSPFNTSDAPTTGGDLVTPSGSDVVVGTNVRYLRCGSAANIVLRYPGSAADITIAAALGEYIPASAGVIIRNTGTTVTPIHAFSS